MAHAQNRKDLHAFIAWLCVMLLWLLLSWVVAESIIETRTRKVVQDEAIALDMQVVRMTQDVDFGLDYFRGMPRLLAGEVNVGLALSRFGANAGSPMPVVERKKNWSENSLLKDIDSHLGLLASSLGVDVIWVTNAAGDCIASSNAQMPESFVGTNYADRDYFRIAQQGKLGQQYAMGRKTNIPGLYFSAPILLNGHFAGVAVIKIDLPKLSHWLGQADAFVSDTQGVVILARDAAKEMHALPSAAVMQTTEAERMARYKRSSFPLLSITPWDSQRFPSLNQFDQDKIPLLLASKNIADESLAVHTFKRIPAAADFERERLKMFFVIGAAGTLVLIIGASLMVYISIRRRSEENTALSASLLRATIESTADGILVVDNERHVTTRNQRFVDLWHIPSELLASNQDQAMMNYVVDQLDDPQGFVTRVMELYAHPELSSFDILNFKEGKIVERYSKPQHLGDRIVGRVWSFRDVTESKNNELALRLSRDGLERKVAERTDDLQAANLTLKAEKSRQEETIKKLADAQNQLLQSEKMAAIGQLAAGVAHEINNPVGFVSSNLTTLQRYVADLLKLLSTYEHSESGMPSEGLAEITSLKQEIDIAFLHEDVGKLLTESIEGLQRVKRIVLDLKNFSHVGDTTMQSSNLEQGMDSTINVVWNELKYKTEVVKEYAGIPEVNCIASQINQVFMNMLMNAAQAIETHGKITIRTGQLGEEVFISIADTGSGISAENLGHLFEPFFTTKPVGKGTGLGLSIAYGIVQKHQGRIEVKSEIDVGTTFCIWLPI